MPPLKRTRARFISESFLGLAVRSVAIKIEKLPSRPLVIEEDAPERGRRRDGPGDGDPAHFHAEMAGMEDDAHAPRIERRRQTVRDERGEPFLILKTPREVLHDPRNLREPHDAI